jgi:8-oxo-dGTP pyrophosphatase MutT (NUDIX family)
MSAIKDQMINQCDGCLRGLPLVNNALGGRFHKGPSTYDSIGCTAHLYETPRAVVVVIQDGDEYLAVTRPKKSESDKERWGIPGGKVDPGETPLESGIREVKEEVGLDLPAEHLVQIYEEEVPSTSIDGINYIVTAFLYTGKAPNLLETTPEDGLKVAYVGKYILTQPEHTPFARYNAGLFKTLGEMQEANREEWKA